MNNLNLERLLHVLNPRNLTGASPTPHHRAAGHIISLQEDRFRLMTDNGDTLLLALGKFSFLDKKTLERWHNANQHVLVDYTGDPNLASAAAHSIQPLTDSSSSTTRN